MTVSTSTNTVDNSAAAWLFVRSIHTQISWACRDNTTCGLTLFVLRLEWIVQFRMVLADDPFPFPFGAIGVPRDDLVLAQDFTLPDATLKLF